MNDEYVAGHLEEELAHAGETDVHVHIEEGRVVISGTVATEARRVAVAELASAVTELLVSNQVTVLVADAPAQREELRPSGGERDAP